jgi:hypothetical protein
MNREHPSTELLLRRLDGELAADAIAPLEEHLAGCAECRTQLAKLQAVSLGIEQYSAELFQPMPTGRRRALLIASDQPAPRRVARLYTALAVAASLMLVAVSIALLTRHPAAAPEPRPRDMAANFIALPDSDENLSSEGSVVMQVDLPRSAVALAGVPLSDGPADARVRAEVVVGADGLARAIRFLN